MDEKKKLEQFAELFRERIAEHCESGVEDEERFQENVFTDECLRTLELGEEVDDWEICHYEVGNIKVNAINLPEGDDSLDLFVSVYTNSVPPETMGKDSIEAAFKKLLRFLGKARDGLHNDMEVTSPAYPSVRRIYEARNRLHRIRLFLLTDARATKFAKDPETIQSMKCSFQVWDIVRLQRLVGEKAGREVLHIDFKSRFGETIPCLLMPNRRTLEHETCVAIFPGKILAAMYEEYGPKLLQKNVRSFLQARGAVNSGIRNTILTQPDRFLAYNNGITATAADVVLIDTKTGWAITSVTDFQIVNGGQTTAGIYYAQQRKSADLSDVFVQAKISRIKDAKLINEIVPLISKYANSQNKISESDFASNDPFHTRIDDLSRHIWTPPAEGAKNPTHWYYERARGQYAEEKAQAGSSARFSRDNPVEQLFDKTDLAKVVSCWDLMPFVASLGPQKNFLLFSKRLAEAAEQAKKNNVEISYDQEYFKKLIGKIIIFKTCREMLEAEKSAFPANRMNVVYYSISYMAYHQLCTEVTLLDAWKSQKTPDSVTKILPLIFKAIYEEIVSAAGQKIVGEWCKKEECWERVRELRLPSLK